MLSDQDIVDQLDEILADVNSDDEFMDDIDFFQDIDDINGKKFLLFT